MPMIDVTIPEGALKPEAEARLIKELSDILITHEGFGADNEVAQSVTVAFLHRPAAVFVAGQRSALPRTMCLGGVSLPRCGPGDVPSPRTSVVTPWRILLWAEPSSSST